ncbi:YjiH family protein [Alteribacillus bidgolensis]|uniref:Nucleoside recognition GATE domain-containing membrane protein YjiH n=1 Tax=Alteribacillus bidgolensis TaxID=930129 RepID=A0A1G8CE14_9BACI|nr:YjiH family protein [Alteribacillus bidgolensis]SDH43704.1 nucleoside recognition GATE domain-containing membrane protein YjiH [Alteribacillus bidgolensis]
MNNSKSNNEGSTLRFLIPSLIGIFLFMIPVSVNGEITIPVALLANWLQGEAAGALPPIASFFMFVAVAGSIIVKITNISNHFIKSLFDVSWVWLGIRVFGLIFSLMVLFNTGPDWIVSPDTGGLLLFDLIPLLITVFLFAGFFLPFLLNFGLLEFCGAILTPIMRPLFTLPGRSSIDCAASWMGDGTIGVLLTNQQYEQGYYSKREAAVIGTTFSIVSITFSIVILSKMDLMQYIVPYYFTIVAAGVAAALIMPRIPPLSLKKDDYFNETNKKEDDSRPPEYNPFQWGLKQAAQKAVQNKAFSIVNGGLKNVLDMWIGVIPVVMALGTAAVVIAETTPFFEIIGMPFVPLLEIMQVPEAAEASQTMVIGFADMFLPAIIGSGIESELTRFIIAALSVTQLIYMSEVGGLLLASKLPVKFTDLVFIFLERTIITLPIIIGFAHLIF